MDQPILKWLTRGKTEFRSRKLAKDRRGKGKGTKDGIEEGNKSVVHNSKVKEDQETEHSIGTPAYLTGKEVVEPVQPKGLSVKSPEYKEWQRRFKAQFGYKPTGMTIGEIQQIVRNRELELGLR